MASSKRLFAGRLYAGRLFAPALWRGVGADTSHALVGQWANVLILESVQPIHELFGAEWVTVGSEQGVYEVELP